MRNPSQPLPLKGERPGGISAQALVDFSAQSVRWAGKGARVMAHGIAAALDAALAPAVVYVTLNDAAAGETAAGVCGRAIDASAMNAEQCATLLAPWLVPEMTGQVHLASLAHLGKLKLLVAPVGERG